MQSVGAVVLNYRNYKETITCVDSLLEQQGVDLHIAVVDNGSANESVDELRKQYVAIPNIFLLPSEENLGFARGMNIGIKSLRSLGIEFIFLSNSDLVFGDPNTLSDMLSSYENGVGVISPNIVNPDGSRAISASFMKKFLRLRMMKSILKGYMYNKTKKKEPDGWPSSVPTELPKRIIGNNMRSRAVVLEDRYEMTGCGYMYTKDFFDRYERMYPRTFLYQEEYATFLYLNKAGLKTAWASTNPVLHKHKASTPKDIREDSVIMAGMRKAGKWPIVKLLFMPYWMIRRIY